MRRPTWKASSLPTTDLVSDLLALFKKPLIRKTALFFILLAVYLIIALPFKVLEIVPGFSDVRPVSMLLPAYGIFFGVPGCLAFSVGNLIGDIASDSLRWSSIAGFVGNFVYPYLMYLFWTKLRKKPFNLRQVQTIALFVLTVIACTLVKALMISSAVAFHYPEVDVMLFFLSVVLNDALFPIGFATPFIILLQEELGFSPLGPKNVPDPSADAAAKPAE